MIGIIKLRYYFIVFVLFFFVNIILCDEEDNDYLKVFYLGQPFYYTVTDGDTTFFIGGLENNIKEYKHKSGEINYFTIIDNGKERIIDSTLDFIVTDDNYWIDSKLYNGIVGINKNTREIDRIIKKEDGLASNVIMNLAYHDYKLYIGYANFGFGIYNINTGEIKNYEYKYLDEKQTKQARYDRYRHISVNKFVIMDDKVILGTVGVGVMIFKNGEFKPLDENIYKIGEKYHVSGVPALYVDDEIIVFSISNIPEEQIAHTFIVRNFNMEEIDIKSFLKKNNLYIEFQKGLTPDTNFPQDIIRIEDKLLLQLTNCIIVYDLRENKIQRIITSKDISYKYQKKYSMNYIYGINMDDSFLWVSFANGLMRIDKEEFLKRHVYGYSKGYKL